MSHIKQILLFPWVIVHKSLSSQCSLGTRYAQGTASGDPDSHPLSYGLVRIGLNLRGSVHREGWKLVENGKKLLILMHSAVNILDFIAVC